MKKLVIVLFVVFISVNVYASERYYIVKRGDTLWGISKMYYKNPVLWGKVWHHNRFVNDPNLIFPGEVLWVSKRGLVLMSGVKASSKGVKNKIRVKGKGFKLPLFLDTVVWYNSKEHVFYGKCGTGYCGYLEKDFSLGDMGYDNFNHPSLLKGDKFFIRSNKVVPPVVYIYERLNYLKFFEKHGDYVVPFIPIASAVVLKKTNTGYWAKIVDESSPVSSEDVVSPVYPYVEVKKVSKVVVGNVPAKCVAVLNYGLAGNDGYYFLLRLSHPVGYVTGKFVEVDRVVSGTPQNTPVLTGYVTAQYDNYVMVFSKVNGFREAMGYLDKYVLR